MSNIKVLPWIEVNLDVIISKHEDQILEWVAKFFWIQVDKLLVSDIQEPIILKHLKTYILAVFYLKNCQKWKAAIHLQIL